MEWFAAPASTAPAELPAALSLAAASPRPTLEAGGQPMASVLLLEIDVLGLAPA